MGEGRKFFLDFLSLISPIDKFCSNPGSAICELQQAAWPFLTYRMSLLKLFQGQLNAATYQIMLCK